MGASNNIFLGALEVHPAALGFLRFRRRFWTEYCLGRPQRSQRSVEVCALTAEY